MRANFDEADSDFVCASNLVTRVDKKLGECVIFVYRLVQIQGARPRK